ncbi:MULTISPECIES: benzoate/H(+) symporter BenE family transporter [Glutamicibacter]|uniref:benzoate/H(+) symporter BenE family transporter n=1 Tax=Glutamicibacter TaxID=1742989 RepID=UPI00167F51E4|nr:benzoate/H(+) symporter BenE family transporter [Glutamicibacter nicotianae]
MSVSEYESNAPPRRAPVLERPGVRPAGLRQVWRDLSPEFVTNGILGVVFSASGPIAVTLAVGMAGGLTQGQLASWVFAIFLSAGLATVVMSLVYRQPLGFAWSLPGTALLGPSLQHLSFPEVVGTFFGCGILVLALGLSGLVRRIMAAIPMPIIMAMVAAVFLRFGTDIVDATQDNPMVAAPMVIAYLIFSVVPALGKVFHPVMAALVVGVIAVLLSGQFALETGGPILATPTFTAPDFTWAAQLELVVPLAITVLFVQNGQGLAVLRTARHHPPVNVFAVASGAFSIVNAVFGGVSACVTGPTNSLLTSSGNKARQYTAALIYAALSLVFALLAPTLVRFMLATPEAFVLALGGIAMLKALLQAFVTAFSTNFTMGALVTFVVTISGLNLFNLHSAFWGIVIGYAVSRILEHRDHVDL